LAKCFDGLFRFPLFVYDFKVGLDFRNKSFPNVEDLNGDTFCFSLVDDLIFITLYKVVFKEPFDLI